MFTSHNPRESRRRQLLSFTHPELKHAYLRALGLADDDAILPPKITNVDMIEEILKREFPDAKN